jgi:sulfatase maturation enzyme AslB (radical SAM superfamily)
MNLKPQHVCHGGCPKHILRWNPDKALQYTEHLENNTEGSNPFLRILRERT